MQFLAKFGILTMAALVVATSGAWSLGGEPGEEERPVIVQPQPQAPAPAPVYEEPVYQEPEPYYEEAPAAAQPQATCYRTCYRPVWKTRDVTCRKAVCKYRDETRTCKVQVPRCETRTRSVTCWKTEWEEVTRHVSQCVNTVDENGCCVKQFQICEVPCKVPKGVPYKVDQEYQVVVTDMVEKEYTVRVPYTEWETFTTQQKYCEWEPYQVEVPPCRTCCRNPCCCR